jgi:hypothetical protein
MVDMSNNSIDNIMPWNIEKAKKVRFIPSPDDFPSRKTSKPPSRDSVQVTSHKLSFPNNFETIHHKHGFQPEFFDEMPHFPDHEILEEDIYSEEEQEEAEEEFEGEYEEGSQFQNDDIVFDE